MVRRTAYNFRAQILIVLVHAVRNQLVRLPSSLLLMIVSKRLMSAMQLHSTPVSILDGEALPSFNSDDYNFNLSEISTMA